MLIHIVQGGENLWEIAKRYRVPIERIIAANELKDANRLTIGQALVIPVPYRYHIVRPGETLWTIARRYGVSLEAIVQANRISSPSVIYPGTVLLIPPRTHTVQRGETLAQIAERQVLDYAVNAIPRNKIFMGFQIYARDWVLPHVQGQEAETFSPQEAVERAVRYGAEIQYDRNAASPFYRYVDSQGRTHEVWFEDARSAQAKFELAKEYQLRGISYWVLGYPYPANWALLKDNFHIRKR